MYLEISGRRTGKTTRLANDVSLSIFKGITPILFLFGHNYYLLDYLSNYEKKKVFTFFSAKSYTKWLIGANRGKIKLYFDEFDIFKKEDIIFDKNAYYVTTPIKLRSRMDLEDPLIMLLNMNNWNYTNYRNSDSKVINDSKSCNYKTDIFGQFLGHSV